ncbi:MAG: phage holin family protein [Faecalibacterium sp.]|jgi:hypothetical protein|nr:phage holin family protein [Faecalibacterium sp.]
MENLVRPELLALIPALNFAATLMKKNGADACKIPRRLGACGVALAVCYELANVPVTNLQSVFDIVFTGVTQGLLCAAGAVYLHQLKHQREKAAAARPQNAAQPAAGAKIPPSGKKGTTDMPRAKTGKGPPH